MKITATNMLNFSMFRQLQRLMVIFVLFFYTMLAYANNGEKATVSVRVTNNSTGSGTIYVDTEGQTQVEKKFSRDKQTHTFTIVATPNNHNIFDGWYYDGEGKNLAFSENTVQRMFEYKENNSPSETYYAKFFFPKVSNLQAKEIKERQFTITWTPPTMPNGYSISKYYVHLYKNPTKDGNLVRCYDVDPTKTELIIENLLETRPYDVHVGVEFYDNNENLIKIENWGGDDNWTHLTNINVTAKAFDGVDLYEGEWYRMMLNSTENITNKTYSFPLNYPCNNLSYEAWLGKDANASHNISVDATNENKNLAEEDYQSNNRYNSSKPIDSSIKNVKFTGSRGTGGAQDIYLDNIYAKIAHHIILSDGTTGSASGTEVTYDLGNVDIDDTKNHTINFSSYLTDGTLTVSSSNNIFKINNSAASSIIATDNILYPKNSTSTNSFSINFTPTSEGNVESTITIADNSNKIKIIVKGKGVKKTPTITWREDKVLVYGINYTENEIATSTCGTDLTFESSDNNVISVENGYLIVNGQEDDKATITVTTAGDRVWNSVTETKEFTVTRKQLQTITWEQNFLLLNTESQPITLNATVNTGKTITYTIADESIATIVNGQLTVKGVVGSTTITAYVAGDDTYYEASMTKQIFVRQKTDNCNGIYAVYDEKGKSYGSGWHGLDWTPIEFSHTLATVGNKLTFTVSHDDSSSNGSDTGGPIIDVKDQNNNSIYYKKGNLNGNHTVQLNRSVTQLKFYLKCNLTRSISNIIVTPAIYLEPKQDKLDFGTIPVNSSTEKTITIDWANQPDMIWATTDNEHFTVVNNAIFGGTCGNYGSTEIKIKFDPSEGKNYTGNLLIGVGENTTPVLTIPLSAVATKINHTLRWQEGIDNEIELNSIFNCNGKAVIVDNDNLHTIKYSYDSEYFDGLEDYPGILYAKKEGTTTITAYIEETETCSRVEVPFMVKILPEKATITWTQDLSNFVEAESEQIVTLDATSNKEGNIIYEIISNEDNIITLSGNTITIAAEKIGNAQIKAYNENYQDVFVIKNVIVASVAPCNTEITHNISLTTDDLIVNAEKEVTHELTLEHSCKSVSFQAAITGGSLNSTSYGRITIITVVNNVEKEIFNKQFYDEGVNTSCDIDPQATKIIFKLYGYHVIGSVAGTIKATLTNVKTVLASDFNNYTTDKERIDFGTSFSVGASSVSEDLKISHWSLPGSINLSIESGNGKATPFSVNPEILNDNCGIKEKTVTVTLNPTIGGSFEDYLVIKTGGEEVIRRIPLTATINKQDQIISWTVDSLTTADRQVQLAKSDKNTSVYYEIVSGGEYAIVENNNLGLSSVSVIKSGTFKVRAYNDDSDIYNPYSTEEKEFTSTIGTIQFDNNGGNGDNNWNTTTNWLPINTLNTQRNVEPSAVVNGVIVAEAVMSDVDGEINNLTFDEGGTLTIGATSGLKANEVSGATADNLTLEASAEGNATFIYNSGTPSATVEMYSKATQGDTPEWQYMGVAVDGATTSDFSGAWLLKWNEAENIINSDPWSDAPLAAETSLMPWAGYSISQPQPATYTMSGSLMNDDYTYTLTRTTREGDTQDPDCGFNLLANSYTAPIDITKLTEEDFVNADACIVLYNTGTYGDWEKGQTDETNPKGQLTVIPVEAAKAISEDQGLPTTIPSMQAFFVRANSSNASFTVNYSTDVAGTEYKGNQMRAPRAEKEFNVLKIMIEGENTRDRLYLLENEETSEAYDNGYEARKIFDAPRGHQMYATCEYGYASIDCSESFVGQTIGLKGDNDGEMLTITFDTDRLDDYESLYLYDKATGKYVNIIAGEEYTFFGIRGADDNRFSIVTNPDDENQTPPFVVIGEELAFDKSQIEADNANIYIYDTSGRLLIMDKINPYENYNIPNMPNGIYLVNMNGYTTKIVKK